MTTLSTVQVASLFVGVLLPILVGLVTKTTTSGSLQAILLLFLSAVSGFASELIDKGSAFVWQQALLTWLVTFVVGVATHYGLWKPTGVSAAAQASLTSKSVPVYDDHGNVSRNGDAGPGDPYSD